MEAETHFPHVKGKALCLVYRLQYRGEIRSP